MYYFYIVRCADNSLYCGQTNNLEKRITEHNSGTHRGAKYTRGRQPVLLVHSETFQTIQEALAREREVKHWPKAKKESLIS